ncbi:HES1 [Mytilus coruscus]|uniref:HES1 n=1 Tax=Mytilus coruscus TaxID=42192 RepID=A0A6J8BMS0_MYTCO|nr:HES1 [Mytilus coruscus]
MAPTDEDKRKISEGSTPDRPKKRVNKPLIEKRRRERINECLNQLQTLIAQLDKDKYKVGRPAKLEKADILEMTVEFVKKTKTSLQGGHKDDADTQQQSYLAGYRKCMDEIQNFCRENNIPSELKTSLQSQIDFKISQMKTEHAIDLTTKSETKDSKIAEQMHILTSNNAIIQPKCLPQVSNSSNQIQNTSVQIVQRPVNSNGQLAVVCQKEPSAYVLVPAICQPFQIPSASQGFPLIVQNNASNYELKPMITGKAGQIIPATNNGHILMLPNSSLSTQGINTNITFTSAFKPLPSESITSNSVAYFPMSSSLSSACVMTPATSSNCHTNSNRPLHSNFELQNDSGTAHQDNSGLENDEMWRPW